MGARLSAVVFDMDGVLIDSEPLHYSVLRDLLAGEDCALSSTEYEQFLGTTTQATLETLIDRHSLQRPLADYLADYNAGVLHLLEQPHAPQPGVVTLIERLRQLQMPLALASSSARAWIDATLRSIGLSDAFDAIASGNEVSRSKPDPEIYLLAAERLGINPECCLAIDDAPNGIASARAAGMAVLAVRTPYTVHLTLDGAQRVVNSLADLDLAALDFLWLEDSSADTRRQVPDLTPPHDGQ
ncbi:MAG TPA: HAD family phosphatase [Chloroflexota bacterium]|nr:HAD family phosphatase [Chloroflexota bacterium]